MLYHLSYAITSFLAVAVAAPLEPRNAAPVNGGAIDLIEGLEGFRANYYYIDGDKTIGMIRLSLTWLLQLHMT